MQRKHAIRAMVASLTLVGLLAAAPSAPAGAQSVPRALDLLERDIAAAMAHAAVLRERLAVESLAPAGTRNFGNAADLAGISDGGSRSSLAALQLAARALDRRMEALGADLPEKPDERRQLILHMRMALGSMLWTIHGLPLAADAATGNGRADLALIDLVDLSLGDLDDATTSLASFAW